MKQKNILVMGSDGMVGHTVYQYLLTYLPQNIWGTTRNKTRLSPHVYYLSVETFQEDFTKILKKIEKIDYIINCIALLEESAGEELLTVNENFPNQLEKLCLENNIALIHISTDAVFDPLSTIVDESSRPTPDTFYGKSKFRGETSAMHALTFRSSFLGFDHVHKKGLLEILKKTNGVYSACSNQQWVGCTSIQFAMLCKNIIVNDSFELLRKNSHVFHFVPLGPLPKKVLIKTIVDVYKLQNVQIKELQGKQITRILTTRFSELLQMKNYISDLTKALKELVAYDK